MASHPHNKPERWFDRSFPAVVPASQFSSLLSRLQGAPDRLDASLTGLSPAVLVARQGPDWSLLQQCGHLSDLEPLWDGRIDDLLSGAAVLRAADLENRASHEAPHNETPLPDLLARFRSLRQALVTRLRGLDDQSLQRTARHPRLDQPMGFVELAHFVAEHDDHHLQCIAALRAALMAQESPQHGQ